jgi:tetratricopeptide (TPR) repeat protein
MTQHGRNDPCPCGSGKKYKKCCGMADKATPAKDFEDERMVSALKKMSEEQWLEAIERFMALEESAPERPGALRAAGSCYEGLEDYARAAECYEKALECSPPELELTLMYQLGIVRACAGLFDESEAAFRKCLTLKDAAGIEDRVLSMIKVVLEMRDGKLSPHYLRTIMLLQRTFTDMQDGRFPEAKRKLETLKTLEPENSVIFYNLGVVHSYLEEREEAAASYERAVHLNPQYVEAWFNLGQLGIIGKEYAKALTCFDRAAALEPDYIKAHHQKGLAWELLGDKEKACACYERLLEIDPGHKSAKENLERIRTQTGRTADSQVR